MDAEDRREIHVRLLELPDFVDPAGEETEDAFDGVVVDEQFSDGSLYFPESQFVEHALYSPRDAGQLVQSVLCSLQLGVQLFPPGIPRVHLVQFPGKVPYMLAEFPDGHRIDVHPPGQSVEPLLSLVGGCGLAVQPLFEIVVLDGVLFALALQLRHLGARLPDALLPVVEGVFGLLDLFAAVVAVYDDIQPEVFLSDFRSHYCGFCSLNCALIRWATSSVKPYRSLYSMLARVYSMNRLWILRFWRIVRRPRCTAFMSRNRS